MGYIGVITHLLFNHLLTSLDIQIDVYLPWNEQQPPLKIGRNPKGNDSIPIINFQVRTVSFRVNLAAFIGNLGLIV